MGNVLAPRRSAARNFAQTYSSLDKPRVWVAQPLPTSVPDTLFRANLSANPLQVHGPIPKPSPPLPMVGKQPEVTSFSGARSSPPSPLLSKSAPVAMNLSESVSPQSQEVSAVQQEQGPLRNRIRMSRKGRYQGGTSPGVLPDEDAEMLPRG